MKLLIYALSLNLFLSLFSNPLWAQIPTEGLIAHWKFESNFDDSSTNGHDGVAVNGATFTFDRFGNPNKALRVVQNLQQYVEVANNPQLQISDELSITFWAKRNNLGGADVVINKGGDWPSGTCNYGLVFSDNTLVFIHNMGYHGVAVPGIPSQLLIPYDGPYGTQLPGVPMDTLWHHYAITTKDGESLVSFYLDGLLLPTFYDGSSIEVDLNPIDTNPLNIGGSPQFSNNAMDEIRMYQKKLTGQEIRAIYCEGTSTASSFSTSACGSYTAPDGSVYTTSGIKTATIPNAAGCDSVISIDLTIVNIDNSVTANENVLIANMPDAEYQWLDCINAFAPIDGENIQNFIATNNGSFAVEISVNGCVDTSTCVNVTSVDIVDLYPEHVVKIYPNPAQELMVVEFSNPTANVLIELMDVSGRKLFSKRYDHHQLLEIPLNVAKGMYFLRINSDEKISLHSIIKQ